MRNERYKIGEILFDIGNERRTAGAGKEALFGKLLRFRKRDHIRAECRFDHRVEAKLLQAGDDLTQFSVCKLTRDGRSDNRIYLVVSVAVAVFDNIDNVKDERFFGDSTPRTLIYASTAGNALVIVNGCGVVRVDRYSLYLTSVLAGALAVGDSREGTYLGAHTAFNAFRFIDMSDVVVVKGYRAPFTNVLASVGKTASAGIGDLVACRRAFVASDVDNLDNVGVFGVTAHCELDPFGEDRAFLINAAAHCRILARRDHFGNFQYFVEQGIVPCVPCDLAQDLIFKMLYLSIEFSHNTFL